MDEIALAGEGEGRLAIIAGGGALPGRVARIVADSGRPFVLIAIRGEADSSLEVFSPRWLDWGQIGRLFSLLRKEGCRDVVMIGGVRRRPSLAALLGDLGTLRRIPRIIRAIVGGDDSVLKNVIGIFEDEGFRIVGVHAIAPHLLAPEGVLTKAVPDTSAAADIASGAAVIEALSPHDVGQAVVVARSRVVAVEAAEGTDQMLARCADLRREGRIGKAPSGVLVKLVKRGQDMRTDLPTIGPRTVAGVAAAGLCGIAVEADAVLVADLEATVAAADEAKLFIIGIQRGEAAS